MTKFIYYPHIYLCGDCMKLDELREAYKRETDAKIRERILMVLWLGEGESSYDVGRRLFCPHSKVLYWKKRFEKEGIAGLRDKPRSGKPPKLSMKSAECIKQRIGDGTGWRTKTIRWLIREEAGVAYSERHVVRLMHAWGFEKIKPRQRHALADEKEREAFLKTTKGGWQLSQMAG